MGRRKRDVMKMQDREGSRVEDARGIVYEESRWVEGPRGMV